MNNKFIVDYNIDSLERSTIQALYRPNFDNFDRIVLLELKKRIEEIKEENISPDDIKRLINAIEINIFKRLTDYQLEVK